MADKFYLFKSARLGFRPFKTQDAEAFFRMNSDPEVLRYTGDLPFRNMEDCRNFIENYQAYQLWGYGRWAMIELSNNRFIGFCGFKYHEEDYVDLGFRILRDKWHKGYATEAAKACLDYGFNALQFKEVIGRVSHENLASIRVLEKVGFEFWKKGECMGISDALYYRVKK